MGLLKILKLFLRFVLLGASVTSSGHFENVAFNKPCKMSSRLPWSHHEHYPGAAVNGDTGGDFFSTNNCIHTKRNDSTPWWEVDLGLPYPVYRISVWGRTGYIYRMKGCIITVDGQECYRFDQVPDTRHTNLTCTSGVLNGSVVRVSKNTTGITQDNITINICEVQIFSCSDGYWGSGCDRRCGNCSNSEVCDKVTGHCSSCPPGLQPPFCYADCSGNYWGSDCDRRCGNCSNSEVCDKVTGHCSSCPPGLQTPLCHSECPNGTFGQNCTQTCSEVCADVCDKVSGRCTCKPGWLGPACSSDEQTGEECSTTGIVAGAVVGTVCAVLLLVTAFLVIRWMRWQSIGTAPQRATNDKETNTSQGRPTADDRNLLTNSSAQLHSLHEGAEGERNYGHENCKQGMSSAVTNPSMPREASARAGGPSGEPPSVSSTLSRDQPYGILDHQPETTYDRPQMYQNTLEHHEYSALKT